MFALPDASTTGATVRTGIAGGQNAVLYAGGDSTDQLFQHWWWYRVNGADTREYGFSNRTSNTAVGNLLTLTYAEPEGLNARFDYRLIDGPDVPAACVVDCQVTLTTSNAAPLSVALFGYVDVDLEGSTLDGAQMPSPGHIRVTDQLTGYFSEIVGRNASAYQVLTYPNIRTFLADNAVDNLNSTGLPFAPADFSSALQWNVSVSPNAPTVIHLQFSLNELADPCAGAVRGDANCDGSVTNFDIDCFILALVDGESAWNSACNAGGCSFLCVMDINSDGRFDNFDIDPFVSCIVNLACP